MGIRIRGVNIRLPGVLQRQVDKLGASQALGARWAWLADLRQPLENNEVSALTRTLATSGLTGDQLRSLSLAARAAAATTQPNPTNQNGG